MILIEEKKFAELWECGLIVFDTCSLLRIYEYREEASVELTDILDYKKGEIWLPHKVKEEFDNRNEEVKNRQLSKYTAAVDRLKSNPNNYRNIIKGILKECEGKRYEDEFTSQLGSILENLNINDVIGMSGIENTAQEVEQDITTFFNRNIAERVLNNIFTNVGQPYSEMDNINLTDEWNIRLKNRMQPGFKDAGKKQNQSGDFIVWKQILDKAKETDRPILFVTADVKSDFWLFDNKIQEKIPHPSLINEFIHEVGREDQFYMIKLHEFIKCCSNYLNSNVDHLIKYLEIDEQIRARFDTWFPEELMDVVDNYLREDPGVRDQISNIIDSCYDFTEINGFEHAEVANVEYNIENNQVYYEGCLIIYADIDVKGHSDRTDFNLGNAYIEFIVFFTCYQDIKWQSEDSNRVVLENELNDIEVFDVEAVLNDDADEDNDSEIELYLDELEDDDIDYDGLF